MVSTNLALQSILDQFAPLEDLALLEQPSLGPELPFSFLHLLSEALHSLSACPQHHSHQEHAPPPPPRRVQSAAFAPRRIGEQLHLPRARAASDVAESQLASDEARARREIAREWSPGVIWRRKRTSSARARAHGTRTRPRAGGLGNARPRAADHSTVASSE